MSRKDIGLEHQNQNYSGIVANLKVYLENLQAIDNASFINRVDGNVKKQGHV